MVDEGRGVVVLHEATCPAARLAAEMGLPVLTMFGCDPEMDMVREAENAQVPMVRHECLRSPQ